MHQPLISLESSNETFFHQYISQCVHLVFPVTQLEEGYCTEVYNKLIIWFEQID